MTRVLVFYSESWSGWPRTGELSGLITWLSEKLLEVPAEYRAEAQCDFDASSDGSLDIEIYYFRPETTEECNERLAMQLNARSAERDHEIALLRALRAKYPND
jgi:hypothetical protein